MLQEEAAPCPVRAVAADLALGARSRGLLGRTPFVYGGLAYGRMASRPPMSSLVVVGLPTVEEAEQIRRELVEIQKEQLLALEDAVVVEKDKDDKVHLRQALNLTAAGAIGGGFWGSLVGLLFLNPLLGAAVGAGIGAASGSLSDLGINDDFLRELGTTLPPGSAALCLLVRDATPDRVIERLRVHAPHAKLLRTNLSHTDEERLRLLLEKASKQAEALRLS